MNNSIKMFIAGEEVVSSNEFEIDEEMLSASSTILNNCYPKSWELTKDYVSNFYYPKDYSRFLLGKGEFLHGNTEYSPLEISGIPPLQFNTNVSKELNAFNIYGNTYQETTNGNQLVDFNNVTTNNASYSFTDDELTITATGGTYNLIRYYITDIVKNNAGKKIRFGFSSVDLSGFTSSVNSIVQMQIIRNGNTSYYSLANKSGDTLSLASYTIPSDASTTITSVSVRFYANNSSTDNSTSVTKITKPLVYLEDNNTYEEYTGAIPSPNPEYPSPIVNVGYQNLLKMTDGTYSNNGITAVVNNGIVTLNGTATANSFINIPITNFSPELNTNYVLSANNTTTIGGNANQNYACIRLRTSTSDVTSSDTLFNVIDSYKLINYNTSYTFQYLRIRTGNGLSYNNFVIKPLLELSTSKHSYIPYGKYGIEVKTTKKNLFDYTTSTFSDPTKVNIVASNNQLTITTTTTATSNNLFFIARIPDDVLENGATYTISSVNVSGVVTPLKLQLRNKDGTNANKSRLDSVVYDNTYGLFVDGNIFATSGTTSIPSGTTAVIKNIQVEKGNEATTYEPYKSNTQIYVLDEPLRAIGNTKDKLYLQNGVVYVERNIGKVIFNGSQTWVQTTSQELTNTRYYSTDAIENLWGNTKVYSNYFKNVTLWGVDVEGIQLTSNERNVRLRINKSVADGTQALNNWFSTHNTEVIYILKTSKIETLGKLEIPNAYEGDNNLSLYVGDLQTTIDVYYYWKNCDVLFAGVVKNSGDISLNPRHPHYCSLQILDYKTFLSESNTLDFVIADKTVSEAIEMVISAISGYGFTVGEIDVDGADDVIGAYSTLNKTAYDVLQYIAEISGSRWRARYVDSSTMAIDFYTPENLPQAEDLEYTQEYFEDNNIVDLTFNYGTRDYRNKQILLSNEVYANISYDETLISNGYDKTFSLQNNIGVVDKVVVNSEEKTIGTSNDKQMGIEADFYYTPGKNIIESNSIYPASTLIHLTYQPLVKGRQIVYNNSEVDRISQQTDTDGVIARYETRNDILSSDELEKIAQTYIEYKGKAEVILTLKNQNKDLYNIGEVVYFDAPIEDLAQDYMVKSKKTEYVVINNIVNLFYTYELTSSFNSEKAINYFDNQRNKATGNIEEGESITRNVDIETQANIIWTEGTVSSATVVVTGNNELNCALNSPFVE